MGRVTVTIEGHCARARHPASTTPRAGGSGRAAAVEVKSWSWSHPAFPRLRMKDNQLQARSAPISSGSSEEKLRPETAVGINPTVQRRLGPRTETHSEGACSVVPAATAPSFALNSKNQSRYLLAGRRKVGRKAAFASGFVGAWVPTTWKNATPRQFDIIPAVVREASA